MWIQLNQLPVKPAGSFRGKESEHLNGRQSTVGPVVSAGRKQ